MKMLKCLVVFFLGIFMFSCASEESSDKLQQAMEKQEITTRNPDLCSSPEPVTFSVSGDKLTVNSIVDPAVNFMAIHKASNYALEEVLCDYWNGGEPPCGSGLTSASLANGDYLLKAATNSGFCWIEFSIPGTTSDPVEFTSSGGTLSITHIDSDITRLDIHNLDYSTSTPKSAICNPWSTVCNAPLTVSGFSTGSRLLRIERPSGVTFQSVTIN